MYLAAAGVGTIGVVDHDRLELSNLQRQIIHTEDRVGMSKAESAVQTVNSLNSLVNAVAYNTMLSSSNAFEIISLYDVVVDCTDNPATRYLVNDACVLTGKPLVSGGALRMDGQLTVYNYKNGPCYRCLFPDPPAPGTVTNCNEGGILGVVTGIMGSIQALETIKLVCDMGPAYAQKMLLLDAEIGTFRTIKIRPRSENCQVCSKNATIKTLIDYEQFCGASANDKGRPTLNKLAPGDRLTCEQYLEISTSNSACLLIDVRSELEFKICALKGSISTIRIT